MNNLNKSIILFSIMFLVFISGIVVSNYKIFPYSVFQSIKNEINTSDIIVKPEINDANLLIHTKNSSLIDKLKQDLNIFLWNEKNLPRDMPNKIEKNFYDERYTDLENLGSIEKLTIEMEHGVNSISYLFKPMKTNEKLIIYHQGHSGDFIKGKKIIQYFLDKNYSVLALSMPLMGMNSQPIIEHTQIGVIKLQSHNQLEFLETENFTPIKFFVEPIIILMNYTENEFNFDSTHMVGISGGGWVTTLSAALDDRLSHSFSIAGSYPLFLRVDSKNFGDYEQHNMELYKIANYLDLYIMASYGQDRKFIQIFNEFDPCCFDGTSFSLYENEIHQVVNTLDHGNFEIFLDSTHKTHTISDHSLEIIINEISVG